MASQARLHKPPSGGGACCLGSSQARPSPRPCHLARAWQPGRGSAWGYTIRGNHTYLPDSRQLFNVFDVQPDPGYRSYWLFANLQLNLDRWPRRLVVAHDRVEEGEPLGAALRDG